MNAHILFSGGPNRHRLSPKIGAAIAAIALVSTGVVGCGSDDDPMIIEENQDNGQDGEVDIDPTYCPSPSTTGLSEVSSFEADDWVGAAPHPPDEDEVRDALLRGEFELPDDGEEAYNGNWRSFELGEDGTLDDAPLGSLRYAGAKIDVDEPTVLLARADGVHQFYVNGLPQPGDVYSDGDKRVPVPLQTGENEILVRFTSGQSPEFELYETDDDLYFNTEDITKPDLRVGTDRTEQLGFPVANLAGLSLTDVEARVVENNYFEASTVELPAVGADASTQIPFELEPKDAWTDPDQQIPVELEFASCQSGETYQLEVELETVDRDEAFNRTFRSPVDNSVQYYGVVPPVDEEAYDEFGLALSMHGASVEASSQAGNYAPKETMYIIAPTNRRPFGFDWEEWGRLNALASLDHAEETFDIDKSRVYATGHSMGGHGTWHMSIHHTGRFAAFGPSAGWQSFYTYGAQTPDPPDASSPLAPARAHSQTATYMSNLANRSGYILHGDADVEVPLSEGENLYDLATEHTDDVEFYIEEGADHWWGYDQDEVDDKGWGYDADSRTECVDWLPMYEFFKERELDVYELDFEFLTPGQWMYSEHSYVTLESTENPYEDALFVSEAVVEDDNGDNGEASDDNGDEPVDVVELTTDNVRAFDIDAAALADRGVTELIVDGDSHDVTTDDVIEIGPRDGKHRGAPGLLNATFHRPFCFVYPDDESRVYRGYAAYLLSNWSIRGNGHGCALPLELLTDEIADNNNLIYLGVDIDEIPDHDDRPFDWDGETYTVGDSEVDYGAGFVTFPDGDHQSAAFIAAEGAEHSLFIHQPFTSRAGMPDYFFFSPDGGIGGGMFDSDWEYDSNLGIMP